MLIDFPWIANIQEEKRKQISTWSEQKRQKIAITESVSFTNKTDTVEPICFNRSNNVFFFFVFCLRASITVFSPLYRKPNTIRTNDEWTQ